MTPDARDRIERRSTKLLYIVVGSILVCTLLPVLAHLIAAFVRGAATGEWPSHQGLAAQDGFPLWDPQLWLAWGPVFCAAAWIVITLPVPLRRPRVPGRGLQLIMLLVIFVFTVPRVAGFLGSPTIAEGGTRYIFVAILALGGLVVLRILLGWLRLLPRSWRLYLDENGAPQPPQRPQRPRSPLSDVPQ